MKSYFLDCGCNIGQSTRYFINENIITSDMEIHLFDPNPYCIERAKLTLDQYNSYNIHFHQVGIWIENCKKEFILEKCPVDYRCQLNKDIIELKDTPSIGGASNIMGNDWNKPHYIEDSLISNFGLVECIDFSEFIDNLDAKNIICKMDIEGAEYKVLDKLIETNVIDKISEFYIEWHNRLLHSNNDTNSYIQEINKRNIILHDWI